MILVDRVGAYNITRFQIFIKREDKCDGLFFFQPDSYLICFENRITRNIMFYLHQFSSFFYLIFEFLYIYLI